jgi:peptidoglycan/LPS O-acetylase OafA/YrhL
MNSSPASPQSDTANSGQQARHSYLELDALRGVAAICVMLYHFSPFLSVHKLLPSAYLAVDLFFVLSGFIIAHAYGARLLDEGMGFGRFVVIRLIRLYPLYILGAALGLFYVLVRNVLMPAEAIEPVELVAPFLLTVLFIPQLGPSTALPGLYPFDLAAWSLFFELAINVIYAAICTALTPYRQRWLIVLGAIGVIAAAIAYGSLDAGMTQETLAGGAARVVLSFFVGIYLYDFYRRREPSAPRAPSRRRPRFMFELLLIGLIVSFMIHPTAALRPLYDVLCVFFFFPLLIWFGARLPSPRLLRPLYAEAGRLSYGIYILHTPLLLIVAGAYKALFHDDPMFARPWSGLAFVAFTMLSVAIIVRVFDEPIRRGLSKLSRSWRAAPATLAQPSGVPPEGGV